MAVKKEQTEGQAGVQSLISSLQKKFGKEVVAGDNSRGVDFVSSGSLSLDIALGGGYALGRIVELKGYESSGKTTLALTACANVQKQTGKAVFYIDRENAIDLDYVEALGVDTSPEKFVLCQPGVAEECLEIMREAIASEAVGCVVLDSVAAMFPRCYLDADVGDSKMGQVARLMSTWLPGFVGEIKKNNILAIFINQYRDNIGVMYGSPKTTPGGKALGFYSSQRLDIAKSGAIGEKGEECANHIKVKVEKNKVAPPLRKAEFDIRFGEGIDRPSELLSMAVERDIIVKKGSFYSYNGNSIAQGELNTRDCIAKDFALQEELEKRIMKTL